MGDDYPTSMDLNHLYFAFSVNFEFVASQICNLTLLFHLKPHDRLVCTAYTPQHRFLSRAPYWQFSRSITPTTIPNFPYQHFDLDSKWRCSPITEYGPHLSINKPIPLIAQRKGDRPIVLTVSDPKHQQLYSNLASCPVPIMVHTYANRGYPSIYPSGR